MATPPKSSTELNLVNWHYFPGYEATGEGGLFAYAVWSLAEIFGSNSGPVLNSFPQLTSADVLTGVTGGDSTERQRFLTADTRLAQIRRSSPRDSDDSGEDFDGSAFDSVELQEYQAAPQTPVAIFLGATDSSLFSEALGEYFAVDYLKLTEQGEQLIDALEAIYGPATFLTFLDT